MSTLTIKQSAKYNSFVNLDLGANTYATICAEAALKTSIRGTCFADPCNYFFINLCILCQHSSKVAKRFYRPQWFSTDGDMLRAWARSRTRLVKDLSLGNGKSKAAPTTCS